VLYLSEFFIINNLNLVTQRGTLRFMRPSTPHSSSYPYTCNSNNTKLGSYLFFIR